MEKNTILCVRCEVRKQSSAFPLGEGGRHKRICTDCSTNLGAPKRCKTCREVKPVEQYHKQCNSPDGYSYNCKDCALQYGRNHHKNNLDRYAERRKVYYEANRERIRLYYATKHRSRKVRVLLAYGGVCVCCEERNLGLLTLDHKNDDGAEHRKSLGHGKTSSRIYVWAEENGFPDLLQVMCWNCNSGRYHNGGICPHKDEEWVSISEAGTEAA